MINMEKNYLIYRDYDDEGELKVEITIGYAFSIPVIYQDVNTNLCSCKIKWCASTGDICSEIADAMIIKKERLLDFFAKRGLFYESAYSNELESYAIDAFNNAKKVYVHSRLGFGINSFKVFYGYKGIGTNNNSTFFDPQNSLKPSGDLDHWLEGVREHIIGNHNIETVMLASFANPLICMYSCKSNIPTIIWDLYGNSTQGKSIAMCAASSIWGNPSLLIGTGNATFNAINESLKNKMGWPVGFIDEATVFDPKTIEQFVYNTAGSQGKKRLSASGLLSGSAGSWSGILMLTSEESIVSKASLNEGRILRVVECNLTYTNDAQHACDIKKFCTRNYGVAYQDYISTLINTSKPDLDQMYNRAYEMLSSAFSKKNRTDSISDRMIGYLCTLLMAGEVVNTLYELNFDLIADCEVLVSLVEANKKARSLESEWDEQFIQLVWRNKFHMHRDSTIEKGKLQTGSNESCHGKLYEKDQKTVLEIRTIYFRQYCEQLNIPSDKLLQYYNKTNRILRKDGKRSDPKCQFGKARPRCYVIDITPHCSTHKDHITNEKGLQESMTDTKEEQS